MHVVVGHATPPVDKTSATMAKLGSHAQSVMNEILTGSSHSPIIIASLLKKTKRKNNISSLRMADDAPPAPEPPSGSMPSLPDLPSKDEVFKDAENLVEQTREALAPRPVPKGVKMTPKDIKRAKVHKMSGRPLPKENSGTCTGSQLPTHGERQTQRQREVTKSEPPVFSPSSLHRE